MVAFGTVVVFAVEVIVRIVSLLVIHYVSTIIE
jgi:hypothetical protein